MTCANCQSKEKQAVRLGIFANLLRRRLRCDTSLRATMTLLISEFVVDHSSVNHSFLSLFFHRSLVVREGSIAQFLKTGVTGSSLLWFEFHVFARISRAFEDLVFCSFRTVLTENA